MQKKQILINAMMTILQIISISVVLFFLYKFLLGTIGARQFGIWSLVLATTGVTQIADLGLSGGVVKFVAKYVARGESENVSEIIQTAVLTIGVTVGLIIIIFFPLIKWALGLVMPQESLPSALAILPLACLALWECIIASIFQSGLDGHQRFDIRSLILIAGAVFHLLLCFWIVPRYGLLGLAYAKVIQNTSVIIASWIALRKIIPSIPVIPHKWKKILFKEMIGYSISFQVMSVVTMFFDPVTKALLSKFGDLSLVGFYQMASKMIQKLHSLVIAANQVLVPAFADMKEKIPGKIREMYSTSYQLLFYLVFPIYFLVILLLPLISEIWVGYYERSFVLFTAFLAVGWLLNTLASPAYHANLGEGNLRWNVMGNLSIALLNIGFGILFGMLYGGTGVIVGWVISLSLGSSIIFFSYHISNKIPIKELVPVASRRTLASSLMGILIAFITHQIFGGILTFYVLNSGVIILFIIIIFLPHWRHPMRRRLVVWVTKELLKS